MRHRRLPPGQHDHVGAPHQHGPVARREHDDRSVGRHHDALLAPFVGHGQRVAGRALDLLPDRAVGHGALRPEVEATVAFAGAAHAFGEDVHLLGHERAVRLRVGRRPDEASGHYLAELGRHDRRHAGIRGQRHDHVLAAVARDVERGAVERRHGAADTARRIGERSRHDKHQRSGRQQDRLQHGGLLVWNQAAVFRRGCLR